MIYLFYGNFAEAHEKAGKLLSSLREKRKEASVVKLEEDMYNTGTWEELIFSQGLFVEKILVYGTKLSENKEHKAFIEKHIKEIAESKNIFIFMEEEISKGMLSLFKKHAEKIVEISSEKNEQKREYNLFQFTDACGERDKKKAFYELEKAFLNTVPADEIHPLLFWQFKTILVVKTMEKKSEAEADKAGIKGFSYRKALSFEKNFSVKELKEKIGKLTDLFHNARFQKEDFELGLVQFVLGL